MKITLDYRHPTPSHCDVAVFVNGALAGVLTLRQEELDVFQDIVVRGMNRRDAFLATGDPGQWPRPADPFEDFCQREGLNERDNDTGLCATMKDIAHRAWNAAKAEPRPDQCPKCGGQMRPGKALQSTMTGIPDFPGGDVVTVSPSGPGRLVDCLKCSGCGFSVHNVHSRNDS